MNKRYRVIIVGSGLAGMAAADILFNHGLKVLVVDDNAYSGGQLLRKPPHGGAVGGRIEPDRLKRLGPRLAQRLKSGEVDFLNGTQVLGIYPQGRLLLALPLGRVSEYRADAIILATGARERQLPFKGWTLPGVMAVGAAQILIKSAGILPGRKTLIGGCGPLMVALAAEITANRGRVQAILDQTPMSIKFNLLAAGPAVWPKLFEGAVYLARLAAARVPIRQGIRIVEARGRRHLEKVVAARVDSHGRIIRGTERTYAAETLAVGYGFAPNIELAQQAGCAVSHALERGGWYVTVGTGMQTSVADIYAAGETTGIAGGGKSLVEGRLAAWDILFRQGRVDRRTHEKQTRTLMRERSRQIRYGRFINQLCRLSPCCYADIPDETIVCRCEEITMGQIRGQLNHGVATMNGIKKATRCGMGNCQGRICGPILFDMISAFSRQAPAAIGTTSARVPVKAVALGALARMTLTDDDDREDQHRGRAGKGA